MNINDVYGDSVWLRATDLKDGDGNPTKYRLRIAGWDTTEFKQNDGSVRKQIVISFHGAKKKLGLNVTNSKMIASMYGDDTNEWTGKEVILCPQKTMNQQGNLVDCIRIEYEAPKKAKVTQVGSTRATPKAAVKQMFDERNPPPDENDERLNRLADEMNDEVPF